MSNSQEKQKRKRTKLECEVCHRAFDDDYRQQHNKKYHEDMFSQGKYIGYKLEGAPANPFALAASARKSKQVIRLVRFTFIYKLADQPDLTYDLRNVVTVFLTKEYVFITFL